MRLDVCEYIRRITSVLPRRPKEEAEHLAVVGRSGGDGEGEVECQRRGTHRGNVDAEAEAGSDPELVGMQRDVLLDGAKVAEERTANHVVGRERKIVFGRVEPLEPAADGNAHVLRRSAAELEAADRGKTAGKIVFEN